MRTSCWLLGIVLASSAMTPAIAGSGYSECLEAANPAECIARRAVNSHELEAEDVLEGVLRHGLVNLVPRKSRKLIRGLYNSIGEPDERMDTPAKQLLDSSAAETLRKSPKASVLAAMGLVAAARHEMNPFANPTYLKLAHKAKDDPRIPILALSLSIEIVGMSGSPPDFRVTYVGLESIWNRAIARKEKDAVLFDDIAGSLAFLNQLQPQAQEFFVWYASRSDLTPYQRVGTASRLVRFFDLPDKAAALMEGIGDEVEGYDVLGVRGEVATARLARGYDAESARLLMRVIMNDLTENGGRFSSLDENKRDALERSRAREELRSLGSECLRRAESVGANPVAADWYAAASDLYLRAGDRDIARDIARRGLPYVPALVRQASEWIGNIDKDDPNAMAVAVQGKGTAPVIALYRTGAVDEALKSRYLTGTDRYLNAERAGEKKDPKWVLDDNWPLYISVMSREAARSTDREFQKSAYDGLVNSCGRPLADCFHKTLRNLALVAAGMGDEPRMKQALKAVARQLDKRVDGAYWALYVAGPWTHCEEVLQSAKDSAALKD